MPLNDFAFGTASVGSRIEEKTFVKLADLAYQAGIRRFDSAPQYGRGLALQFIARHLQHRPDQRWAVTTKLGRLPVPDAKSVAIVLARGELKQALVLLRTPKTSAVDFSVANLTRGLAISRAALKDEHISHVFLHSPPSAALAGPAGTFLVRECSKRWRIGCAEPQPDDIAWCAEFSSNSAIQVTTEQVLRDPAIAGFGGELWINSIIRYGRANGLSIGETMQKLNAARPANRVFVVGFNHTHLFEEFAAA